MAVAVTPDCLAATGYEQESQLHEALSTHFKLPLSVDRKKLQVTASRAIRTTLDKTTQKEQCQCSDSEKSKSENQSSKAGQKLCAKRGKNATNCAD